MKMIGILLLISLLFIGIYYFFPESKLPKNSRIDHIEVWKSKHRMQVFSDGKLLKTYVISLGKNPIGHKQFEGDNKTPEGRYSIDARNSNSGYYKNLGISYPNPQDAAFAQSKGKSPGGHVKIHGLKNGRGFIGKFHRWKNWTAGCIAVTDSEMEELYQCVLPDAQIVIHP